MDYSEYLKNPLWIRKRKRIILRDGKQCTVCSDKKNLQVHHTFYYTDYREPWRYPDERLITVCEKCHKEYHEYHEHEFKKPPKIVVKKKFKPRRKVKKPKKEMSLKELYKIWEPRLNNKKYRLIKYDKTKK